VRFAELAQVYAELEATTKRLEMRATLVRLLQGLKPKELPAVIYLSQGLLRPEYEGLELGVADSLVARAVAQAFGRPDSFVSRHAKSSGDIGSTAEEIAQEVQASRTSSLEVEEVYDTLLAVAKASGEGSQEQKVKLIADLLRRATPLEARYVARFVVGKLRLGVREMTILDALAQAFAAGSKEAREKIEAAFNLSSDLGLVALRLASRGLEGLQDIGLEVGRPIRPMLAERAPDLGQLLQRMEGRAAFEYKYDGLRVQAHVPHKGPVRLFSRRLEELSAQFPELVEALPGAIRRTPTIVEGECVSIDPDTEEIRPFQDVSRRRGRKYDIERMKEEIPVRLYVFDVLLDGTETVIDRPFPERRRRLVSTVRENERVHVAIQEVVESEAEAQQFFDRAIADGCEGIMAKSLAEGSRYRAGARGFWWIKYKRDYTHALADSIDGVVVGAFHGRGRRAGRYGALLCAAYNPALDRFETFCKVGSGFDDETLDRLPRMLQQYVIDTPPADVVTGLTPDVWIRPSVVLEIRGAELTLSPNHRAGEGRLRPGSGLALRFPRFTGRFRDDKKPDQATTVDELVEMYSSQVKRSVSESSEASADPGG
jgi:DNA ligase 1